MRVLLVGNQIPDELGHKVTLRRFQLYASLRIHGSGPVIDLRLMEPVSAACSSLMEGRRLPGEPSLQLLPLPIVQESSAR